MYDHVNSELCCFMIKFVYYAIFVFSALFILMIILSYIKEQIKYRKYKVSADLVTVQVSKMA